MCAVKNKENIDYFGAVVYITIAINLNFTLLLYFLKKTNIYISAKFLIISTLLCFVVNLLVIYTNKSYIVIDNYFSNDPTKNKKANLLWTTYFLLSIILTILMCLDVL